jgi:hypothetical protein
MAYLDGIKLDDLVQLYGAQPPGRVVSILDQVCGALAEAHEAAVRGAQRSAPGVLRPASCVLRRPSRALDAHRSSVASWLQSWPCDMRGAPSVS